MVAELDDAVVSVVTDRPGRVAKPGQTFRTANSGLIALQKKLDCFAEGISPATSFPFAERHAFKFSNGGLEFIIELNRVAIVGSWPFHALSRRGEPMADDDRPLRHLPRSLMSIRNLNHESRK
jgi:hypothetical protein